MEELDLKNYIPSYNSGIYLFKMADQTKFGFAKDFGSRWGSREYRTAMIYDVATWSFSTYEMVEMESRIREEFRRHLRPGKNDYLMGDHFYEICEFMKLFEQSKTLAPICSEPKLFGVHKLLKEWGYK
jgi:hypothetical protein